MSHRNHRSSVTELTAVVMSFMLISAGYFYATIATARYKHFWMDEVLAVSIARLPSFGAIWSAIWNSAEFSPPTYHFFLHALLQVTGEHGVRLIARMPSIIAVYIAALIIFVLVRPRLGFTAAVISLGVILTSGLLEYAVQARQYSLLALGLAAALLIWDGFPDKRHPNLRAIALWLVLSICLSLHFYGIVLVATIGVAELLWFATRREFRLRVWLPLAATGLVEAAWYPLASHLATVLAGDTLASNYYGRPTLGQLKDSLFDLVIGGEPGAFRLLVAFMLVGLAYLLKRSPFAFLVPEATTDPKSQRRFLSRLEIMIIALCALPIITFSLSYFVTKSFVPRYTSGVALLSGIAAAYIWSKLPTRHIVALGLVPLLAVSNFNRLRGSDPIRDVLSSLEVPRTPMPVVVGDGLLYIELMEAADPKTRSRLVYLLRPPGSVSPDPTNENEVQRLASFNTDYRVSGQEAFLASNPNFYVVVRPWSIDTTTQSLIKKGLLGGLLTANGNALIFRAGQQDATQQNGRQD